MSKKVRDAMTSEALAVAPGDSLRRAAEMLKQHDVGSLPVVDDGRLVGIITDRDIVVRAVAEQADPGAMPVEQIASSDPVAVQQDQDLTDALEMMAYHRVRRLPVIASGQLVGMIAQADVAIEANEKSTGAMLESISQP
jgi:CBS domain-containing protein